MNGWLVYSRENAERNQTFISFWMQAARQRNVRLELIMTDQPIPDTVPDFAVVRVMDPALSYRLESRGIPVFNPACVSACCNDKWNTYRLAETLGVPFPRTEYIPEPAAMQSHPYPYVIKSCFGHGGTQVFLVKNRMEEQAACNALRGVPSVLQECVSDLGRDLRVYVLGGQVIASMLRVSKIDFRSNFCLGGSAVPHELTKKEKEIVHAFTAALPIGLVGIDMIYHEGAALFNEIEDVVGCRMLYSMTNIQPVEMYLDWILSRLKIM